METQTGYKASELGQIPQDWDVVELGEVAFIKTGSKNNQDKKENGQYPFFVRSATVEQIDTYSYACEAILIPGEGNIGSIFHYINGKFDAHQRVYVIRDFNNVIGKFVFFALKQNFGKHAMGNTVKATVDSLRLPTFQNFKFAIPKSTAEQTAIAAALSDTDALIGSLKTLIAKKQAIKLSAMQNLLSGKIRLPEFAQRPDGSPKTTHQTEQGLLPEDWEVVELGKVAEIKSGGTPSTHQPEFWNGHILWCTPTDITSLSGKYLSDTNRKISELGLKNSVADLLPIGSVLMTSRATIGECAIASLPMTTNQGFKNFICNERINNEFLYYLLSNQKDKFIELCNGSTFLEISTTQVRKFLITIPKSTTEQTAIAQLLSDMDAEIEALECRLKKTQSLKQGMMQALLSGKIRLPLK